MAKKVISKAKTLLAATGAGAGAVSNPLAMVPLAAAEVGFVLKQESKLVGLIAAIMEPSALENEDLFTADVLAIVFPNAASQALREFAVRAGQATTRTLIRKYISKDVLKAIVKFALKYLGIKVTQRAIITKALPLVGAVIGASWNWVEVKQLGNRAIIYYLDREFPPE